jgi:hypothetical protein
LPSQAIGLRGGSSQGQDKQEYEENLQQQQEIAAQLLPGRISLNITHKALPQIGTGNDMVLAAQFEQI